MKKYKLDIEFNGSNYLGWQIQKDKLSTVQGVLNQALAKLYNQEITTIASGRTDTGVHSLCHSVLFEAPLEIQESGIKSALNSSLPKDIRIKSIVQIEDFHPLRDAGRREYRYLFTNNERESAFQQGLILNHFIPLDITKMQVAAKIFIGTHDFTDFHCTGSETKSNIRTIYNCEIIQHEMDFHGILPSHYYLRIVGDGFLKQMVRAIMGSLLKVGEGKLSLTEIEESLKRPKGKILAPIPAPSGLYKFAISFNFDKLAD